MNMAVRLAGWSLVVAGALVGLVWAVWGLSGDEMRAHINALVSALFYPALVMAASLSKHPDDISKWIWVLSQVTEVFLVAYCVFLGVALVRRHLWPR